MARRRRRRRGGALTEYAILIGLLALALVGAVRLFAGGLSGAFGAVAGVIDEDVTGRLRAAPGPGTAPPGGRRGKAGVDVDPDPAEELPGAAGP